MCQQSRGKLIGTPHEFGTRVTETKDLQHGWNADLGVSHVAPKKGLLEALPFGVGVVSGEWWESLSVCPIIPEWCHVVPDYTTPALYRTKESVFLRGAASPPPDISLAAPVFSHELPAHDLKSDESLCDLGLRVVRGGGKAKECENRYRILVDSCGTQPDAAWDLLSNAHSRQECFANPKLPRRWVTRPGKVISALGRDPLQRASQQCSACWPEMKNLFPTQCSAIAAEEDAKEQTWHTDVEKLPGTLTSKGGLHEHLSMMLVLPDKYHLEVHLSSHLGERDALRGETFQFPCGDMVLFASTLRHRGLATLPGMGKKFLGGSIRTEQNCHSSQMGTTPKQGLKNHFGKLRNCALQRTPPKTCELSKMTMCRGYYRCQLKVMYSLQMWALQCPCEEKSNCSKSSAGAFQTTPQMQPKK